MNLNHHLINQSKLNTHPQQPTNSMQNRTKFITLFIIVCSCIRPCHSAEQHPVSIPRKIFNFFFPVVTVELRNNVTRHVHVKCGVEEWKDELLALESGESISWSFREILFPLKWCYVHVNDDVQGVFWASHVRLQCTDCHWIIQSDGVYFYRQNSRKWIKNRLLFRPLGEIKP